MQKRPIPLASKLGAANPGTAGAVRMLPPHEGGPGQKSSPNGVKLQALANIATKRHTKSSKRMSTSSAKLGKGLPATTGLNDSNEQHPVKAP